MVDKTIHDLLSVNVDSLETKFLNATTIYSFQATGPNGEIIFNSSQSVIPGFIADTASLAFTASNAPLYLPLVGGTITGNLTVNGTAYLNSVVASTSSYNSGSTIFGDALSDIHQFTGSVFITGSSLTWNNSTLIASNVTSSMSVASASYASQAGNSSTINVNVFSAPVDSYLLMSNVAGTTGVAIGGDADLRYNTSTNVLTVSNVSAMTLTGSLLGTASNAISALTASFYEGSVTSASYAATASKLTILNEAVSSGTYYPIFAYSPSGVTAFAADASTYTYQPSTNILTVTASLSLGVSASSINSNDSTTYDTSNINSINWDLRRLLDTAGNGVLDWAGYSVVDSSGNTSIDWENREIYDENFKLSIKYSDRREMCDTGELVSLDWGDRILVDPNGTTTLDWSVADTITINGNSIITGSVAIGTGSIGNGENNLLLGPAPAGGTGEGGQIAFLAAGGSYTSSSFIDNWQNQFRILRGPGAVSNAGLMYMDLQTGNTNFIGAVTASGGYSNLPNDYLYVTRNTTQTIGSGTWANRDIIFNNSVVSKGISYNTGTGLASLTGGKVYRITARLAWSAAGAYLLEFSCYDSSNTQLGPTTQIVQSTNGSNNISDGTLDFIYAPGSNVDIKIRTTNNTNALTGESIRGDLNTQLIIQQIA